MSVMRAGLFVKTTNTDPKVGILGKLRATSVICIMLYNCCNSARPCMICNLSAAVQIGDAVFVDGEIREIDGTRTSSSSLRSMIYNTSRVWWCTWDARVMAYVGCSDLCAGMGECYHTSASGVTLIEVTGGVTICS